MFGKESLHKNLKKVGQGGSSSTLSVGDWYLSQNADGHLVAINIATSEEVVIALKGGA